MRPILEASHPQRNGIARRVAVAGAVHGAGQVPGDLDESLFAAERDFLNSVPHALGLVDLAAVPFPEALAQIDAGLMAADRERIPEPAPE